MQCCEGEVNLVARDLAKDKKQQESHTAAIKLIFFLLFKCNISIVYIIGDGRSDNEL
jgi:hypothetical protein